MRLGVNSEAESMWKRPAPERWGQGRSAAQKKKAASLFQGRRPRHFDEIQAPCRRIDLPRD
jgi:hypothetical protein